MFRRWLCPFFSERSPSPSGVATRGRVRLALERLEDRWVPSAFSYDATTQTLTITGTPSNDLFQYNQSTTAVNALGGVTFYTFTMNGETQQYGGELTPHIAQVIVNGNGGADTATLTINDGYQLPNLPQTFYNTSVMILGPGGGRLQHDLNPGDNHTPQPTDFMFLNQFRTTYTYLTNGNKDSAQLTDSTTGSDRFVTAGTYAYMTDNPNNPTYFQFVSGASNVYGYSTNPGHDSTTHYDAAGSVDAFVSSGSAYSYLSGSDANNHAFFNEAVGFTVNYAVATHGNAIAYLIDSPRNDVFVGHTAYSYLYSDNADGSLALFNLAQGFQKVYAQSFVGGTDFAYNFDVNENVLGGAWIMLT
jgi:hypothetical protein